MKYHENSNVTPTANRPAKSAHRVLELLEFFADEQRGVSIKEICTALHWPQSSTSVLLKSLSDAGFFDHDPRTGMYTPNLRLALATAWIEEHMFSEQGLLPLMRRVHDACGHTVIIGKLQGAHVRYLHVLQATRPGRFTAKIGSLRPLFLSAPGQMLLATRSEREIPGLLRRANADEVDPARQVSSEQALALRAQARSQGWAMSNGSSIAGAAGLAILLPVPRHHDALTFSVGGPIAEIERDREMLLALLNDSVASFKKALRI